MGNKQETEDYSSLSDKFDLEADTINALSTYDPLDTSLTFIGTAINFWFHARIGQWNPTKDLSFYEELAPAMFVRTDQTIRLYVDRCCMQKDIRQFESQAAEYLVAACEIALISKDQGIIKQFRKLADYVKSYQNDFGRGLSEYQIAIIEQIFGYDRSQEDT